MIAEGADIIDVGGESTRPGSEFVSEEEELRRVIAVIEKLAAIASVPISIDTTKPSVARAACEAGAEIINDISGLRFDPALAAVATSTRAALLVMHSRGTPKDMQQTPFAADVFADVVDGLHRSISIAEQFRVPRESIAIDPGIGFGKSVEQNLEIIRRLSDLSREFGDFPIVIGTSRKSFLGKLLNGAPADERLYGTIATVVASVLNGAHIVRVHDVKAAVDAVKVADAIRRAETQDSASTRTQ
jgi:dihydropteroate synthase